MASHQGFLKVVLVVAVVLLDYTSFKIVENLN